MERSKTPTRRKVSGRNPTGKAFSECISTLFDEIQLAVTWDRPSILMAVHTSKAGQAKAEDVLLGKLKKIHRKVVRIRPDVDAYPDILHFMAQNQNIADLVFFVESLGDQPEVYRALNLHRELLVDHRVKVVFWLTNNEAKLLPYSAPDFWAFRHRVVEFAPDRSSSKKPLPAGALIWAVDDATSDLDEKISAQEKMIGDLSHVTDADVIHAEAAGTLANLYWLKGENQKSMALLQKEFEHIRQWDAEDVRSSLLNGLAILNYDQGRYEDALGSIDEAVKSGLYHDALWANHAVILHALGRGGEALRSLKKALSINPGSSRLRRTSGYVYVSMGRYDAALFEFEKALLLDADDLRARLALAFCYSRTGNIKACHDVIQKTVTIPPGDEMYVELFLSGLTLEPELAIDRLRTALSEGLITSVFLRRDPVLNFVFDLKHIGLVD